MRRLWYFFAFQICMLVSTNAQECVSGNCVNGKGVMILANGSKYIGYFKNKRMHGLGAFYYQNGMTYVGQWVEGWKHGKGELTFSNGEKFTGDFQKNKFNGAGVYLFQDNERYEGNFVDGKFNGQGTYYYKDGKIKTGQWVNNKMIEKNETAEASTPPKANIPDCNITPCNSGKGKLTYSDGSVYVGEFKEGRPQGQGYCKYSNGDVYFGGWLNDAPEGSGKMTYANGKVQSGVWKNGKIGTPPADPVTQTNTTKPVEKNDVDIYAVIVGVSRYETFPHLKYADDDAFQYYAFLKSPEGGALEDDKIKILVDESAVKDNIVKAMEELFYKADENDVVMLYFSGHGINGSFLPIDSDGYKNRLTYDELKTILGNSKAKQKVCLADACFSGSLLAMKSAYSQSLNLFYTSLRESAGGTAFLLSSKQEEVSLESQGLRQGLFSHYVIKGLKGAADVNKNKIVTIKELYDYVYQNVKEYSQSAQTPTIAGNYDPNMPVGNVR